VGATAPVSRADENDPDEQAGGIDQAQRRSRVLRNAQSASATTQCSVHGALNIFSPAAGVTGVDQRAGVDDCRADADGLSPPSDVQAAFNGPIKDDLRASNPGLFPLSRPHPHPAESARRSADAQLRQAPAV
jgi:hypothetical protein